jgi:hypothetical protein
MILPPAEARLFARQNLNSSAMQITITNPQALREEKAKSAYESQNVRVIDSKAYIMQVIMPGT